MDFHVNCAGRACKWQDFTRRSRVADEGDYLEDEDFCGDVASALCDGNDDFDDMTHLQVAEVYKTIQAC